MLGKTYSLFLVFFFLIFVGCSKSKNTSTSNKSKNNKYPSDRIFLLIKKGRNTSNSLTERQNNLNQAYVLSLKENKDSLKTKYFSRLSLAYSILKDSSKFRETNKITLQMSEITKDSLVKAEAFWDLAYFLNNYNIVDSAYYNYSKAQKIFDQLKNNASSAAMLYNLATIQQMVRDYTGSEINLIKAIELLKPLEDYNRLYNCYNLLGNVATNLKEYNRAIEYHKQAKKYLANHNLTNKIPQNLYNTGLVYQEQKLHKKALDYFIRVLSLDSLSSYNPRLYSQTLTGIATSSLHTNKDYEILPKYFNQAIAIQDSLSIPRELSESYYALGEYYIVHNKKEMAFKQLLKAKELAKQSSNFEQLLQTLEILPSVDPKNATIYAQAYIKLNDSLQQAERTHRNKFARIRFETDEFIAQNDILDRQRQIWLGIAVGTLVLGLLVFIVITQRIKNQRLKFEQNQQKSNEEIFNLLLDQKGKVEEGKQMEKKRISEELHDGVLGQMLGVRLILTGLNKKTDEKAIEQRLELIGKLQVVEEDIRTISHELSHSSYEKVNNFIASIKDLLTTTSMAGKFEYNFTYDKDTEWDKLTGDAKINIYRIVQESIQNCVKHAKAKNIEVNFAVKANDFLIIVTDNGAGFEPKKKRKGIGLRNITSRINKLEGTYAIKSKVGEGTTVTLIIPQNKNLV